MLHAPYNILVVRSGIAMDIDIRSERAADSGALVNVYKLLQTGGLRHKPDNCCHCWINLFTVGGQLAYGFTFKISYQVLCGSWLF